MGISAEYRSTFEAPTGNCGKNIGTKSVFTFAKKLGQTKCGYGVSDNK